MDMKRRITNSKQRRFLLFSSVDTQRPGVNFWLQDSHRTFDVALCVYRGEVIDLGAEYYCHMPGYKYPNLERLSRMVDLSSYDAVYMPDDDIEITTEALNKLFDSFMSHALWIAQPAYDHSSASAWLLCHADPQYHLRYTNFVEVGTPLMSRDTLAQCLPVMAKINSGWGADFLFPQWVRAPRGKIAVIDDVQCHHPTSESAVNAQLNRRLHPWDGEYLMAQHATYYFTPRTLGGIKTGSREVKWLPDLHTMAPPTQNTDTPGESLFADSCYAHFSQTHLEHLRLMNDLLNAGKNDAALAQLQQLEDKQERKTMLTALVTATQLLEEGKVAASEQGFLAAKQRWGQKISPYFRHHLALENNRRKPFQAES